MNDAATSPEQDIYDSGVEMAYKANDELTKALEAQALLDGNSSTLSPEDRSGLKRVTEKSHKRFERYSDAVGTLIGPQVYAGETSTKPELTTTVVEAIKPIERIAEYPPQGSHNFFRNLITKVLNDSFHAWDLIGIDKDDPGQKLRLYDADGRPALQTHLEAEVPKPADTIVEKVRKYGAQWADSEIRATGNDERVRQAIGYLVELVDRISESEKSGTVDQLSAESLRRFIANGFRCREGNILNDSNSYYLDYVHQPEYDQLPNTENAKVYYALKEARLKHAKQYRVAVGTVSSMTPNDDWIQFNPPHNQGEYTDRIYIAFRPDANGVEQGVDAWFRALEATHMTDKITFKIGIKPGRLDQIVVYPTKNLDDEKLQNLLETFTAYCPAESRASQPALSGVELSPGIAYAPEPEYLQLVCKLLNSKNKRSSFGEIMSGLSELAMQVAYVEIGRAMPEGQGPSQMKVIETAEQIFQQYLTLLDLNPDSFVPNSRGGKLPTWAQRIRDTQARRPQ